jgi:hypothetical protein
MKKMFRVVALPAGSAYWLHSSERREQLGNGLGGQIESGR